MIGAIIGDIVGSAYEFNPIKTKDFVLFPSEARFTDDSILTIATASAILTDGDFTSKYAQFSRDYPKRGYGRNFYKWISMEVKQPYNSFGNGSAMRVSPVGWAYNDLDSVLKYAQASAEITHNHPQGIKGAQATASAIFLARKGLDKSEIKKYLTSMFGYRLGRKVVDIRPTAKFDETCPQSVEEAIDCFLDSTSFEDAIRNAVSLGADADTQACIAGSIAQAYYKTIPKLMIAKAYQILDNRLGNILLEFTKKFVGI